MTDNANAACYCVNRHANENRAQKIAFREAAGDKRSLTHGALAEASGWVVGAYVRVGIRREERALTIGLTWRRGLGRTADARCLGGGWVLEPVRQKPCDIGGRMDAHWGQV